MDSSQGWGSKDVRGLTVWSKKLQKQTKPLTIASGEKKEGKRERERALLSEANQRKEATKQAKGKD